MPLCNRIARQHCHHSHHIYLLRIMKLPIIFLLQLGGVSSFSSLSMNYDGVPVGRSPLSQQYKSIMSIHRGISGGYPRMAPPGEPEPEVRRIFLARHATFHFVFGRYLRIFVFVLFRTAPSRCRPPLPVRVHGLDLGQFGWASASRQPPRGAQGQR